MRTVPRRFEIYIPTKTILQLLAWVFIVSVVVKLWPELVYLSLSLLLAVALSPLVDRMSRTGLGRSASVALIALTMLATGVLVVAFVFPPLMRQGGEVAANFPAFSARAQQHLPENPVIKHLISELLLLPTKPEVAQQLGKPLVWGQIALSGVTATLVVLIIALYLVLDGRRLYAWLLAYVPRRHREKMARTVPEVSEVVFGYVRGQVLLSLIIGTSAGIGMWVLGTVGLVPGADKYAVLFGAWVAVMELIPYLGPWLGAIPPIIYALVVHPISAVWVALLFLGIHQIEGHIVVPNVMGSALRLHPLLAIFGLLAGGELYGLPGILVALPFLAVMRALWEFFGERVQFDSWEGGAVPVEVDVEETRPVKPVPPEEPPEAKVAP